MRDPLLDGSSRVFTREKQHVARARVAQIADADRAVANLAALCLATFSPTDYRVVCHDASAPALLSHLGSPSRVFPDVMDDRVRTALWEGLVALLDDRRHELRDAAAVVLGKAVSAAMVDGIEKGELPTEMLMAELRGVAEIDDLTWLELNASLEPALHKHETIRTAFLGHLRSCVDKIDEEPGKHVPETERELFERYVQEWRDRPRMVDLWRGTTSHYFPAHFDELNFIPAILKCCPTETLQCLDKLRFPDPLLRILATDSIRNDRDWIAKLLQCAPGSVDGKNTWNGSLLAMLLLQVADDHCRSLWTAVHRQNGDMNSVQQRLSSWLGELASLVMRRTDAHFLATHWLLMKAADERLERAHGGRQDVVAQSDMIGWIGSGLVRAGMSGKRIADFVDFPTTKLHPEFCAPRQSAGDGDRWPRRLPAVAMMAMLDCMDDDKVQDDEDILRRLDVLLAVRDPSFEAEDSLDVGSTGLPASCIGYVLAEGKEPTKRWRRSWGLLAGQRRVVQHWRHTRDADAMAPSLFLLSTGLAALDWLCSESNSRQDEAEKLWRIVFDAAQECRLTISVVHLLRRIDRDVGRLFARHPAVFGNSDSGGLRRPNRDYSDILANDLSMLGGDDVLVARCCELVSRNLNEPGVLDQALKCNSNLGHALLKQFVRWQELERDVKRESKLLEAIRKMGIE